MNGPALVHHVELFPAVSPNGSRVLVAVLLAAQGTNGRMPTSREIRQAVPGLTRADVRSGRFELRGAGLLQTASTEDGWRTVVGKADPLNPLPTTPPRRLDGRHGQATTYTRDHCRCEACRAWARETHRARYGPAGAYVKRDAPDPHTIPRPHGTNAAYQLGCRCEPCRVAHSRYQGEWRAANRAGLVRPPADRCRRPPPDPATITLPHGSGGAYRQGCRCDSCRSTHSQYLREWRARRR